MTDQNASFVANHSGLLREQHLEQHLNCHSDNQDVVNDIPAKVPKKSIKKEYQDKQSAVFKNYLITKENGMPGIKVSCEVDSESDDTIILSDDKKNAKVRHI